MSQPSRRALGPKALAAYEQPRVGRSVLEIMTSVVPYLAASVLIYLSLDVSYLLALALVAPAAGFLLQEHKDCCEHPFIRKLS